MTAGKKLIIFVSSAVHGNEALLNQIYSTLKGYGYEVWMSYKGTVPHNSHLSTFDNCLVAVQNCDLFLGLITPFYGSGRDVNNLSITHLELRKAIEINKLRWVLAQEHVTFARIFLKNLGYIGIDGRRTLSLEKKPIFEDLRIIDMYEEAISNQQPLAQRRGNWVQTFSTNEDVLLYIDAQLSDYNKNEKLVHENSFDDAHDPQENGNNGDSL